MYNLVSFDGYILYSYLIRIVKLDDLTALIDHNNKFVSINIKLSNNIVIKDSYRVFPVSFELYI